MRPPCTRRKAGRHQLYATTTRQRTNKVRIVRFAVGAFRRLIFARFFSDEQPPALTASNLANRPHFALFVKGIKFRRC